MKTFLVTGGAGFVGSHIALSLKARFENTEVKVIDKKKDTPPKTQKSSSKSKKSKQLGKKPVKIDIKQEGDEGDETVTSDADESGTDDDNTPPPSGKINIPIDFD